MAASPARASTAVAWTSTVTSRRSGDRFSVAAIHSTRGRDHCLSPRRVRSLASSAHVVRASRSGFISRRPSCAHGERAFARRGGTPAWPASASGGFAGPAARQQTGRITASAAPVRLWWSWRPASSGARRRSGTPPPCESSRQGHPAASLPTEHEDTRYRHEIRACVAALRAARIASPVVAVGGGRHCALRNAGGCQHGPWRRPRPTAGSSSRSRPNRRGRSDPRRRSAAGR